jgi:hypothetical protein
VPRLANAAFSLSLGSRRSAPFSNFFSFSQPSEQTDKILMMSKQTVLAPSLKLVTTSSAADAPLSSHPNLVGLNLKPPCPSSNGSADAVNTAALEAGCIQQETIISNKKHGNLKRPASKISLNDYEASLTRSSSGDLVRLEAAAESASGVSLPPLRREGQGLTEKKLRRLEKNRISARECRRKKREAAQNMEREINILESENLRLRLQLQVSHDKKNTMGLLHTMVSVFLYT